jgi:hypothetical protein
MIEQEIHKGFTQKKTSDQKNRSGVKKSKENAYLEEEIRQDYLHRIKQYISYGLSSSFDDDNNAEHYSTRRIEMEYWRLKMKLKERELENNCKTMITVGSDVTEAFLNAINIKGVHTRGLGKRTHEAVEAGKFHAPIRFYAQTSSPSGESFLTNPFISFMAAFATVAFQNHISGKNEEAQKSRDSHTKKPRKHQTKRRTKPVHMAYTRVQSPKYALPDNQRNNQMIEHAYVTSTLYSGHTQKDIGNFNIVQSIVSSSSDEELTATQQSLNAIIPAVRKIGEHSQIVQAIEMERSELNKCKPRPIDL